MGHRLRTVGNVARAIRPAPPLLKGGNQGRAGLRDSGVGTCSRVDQDVVSGTSTRSFSELISTAPVPAGAVPFRGGSATGVATNAPDRALVFPTTRQSRQGRPLISGRLEPASRLDDLPEGVDGKRLGADQCSELRPSLISAGLPKRTWRRSIRRAMSRGVTRSGHLDPLAIDELRSVALRSARNFVIASSMASMAWSRTSASRAAARSAWCWM